MSETTSGSKVERHIHRLAALQAIAQRKQQQSDRHALQAMKRLQRSLDSLTDVGGFLKLAIARINDHQLNVPAERKRKLLQSASGRTFHATGHAYSRSNPRPVGQRPKKGGRGAAAAHYRYIEDGNAAGHLDYLNRTRVEAIDVKEEFVPSNIPGNFVDRMRFFELVDAFERQSAGDKVTIDFDRNRESWNSLVADPDCDSAVSEAYQKHLRSSLGKPTKILLEGSAKEFSTFLKCRGVELPERNTNEESIRKDGIALHPGRSGRTHFRWVFELPREFDARQRRRALRKLCEHIGDLGCMYAAVIHAPDPHNDPDNHHIHLMFYDRPCRRLSGDPASDLQNVPANFKDDVRAEMLSGQVQPGEWDFTVARHYKSGRTWKIHYPFRAKKCRLVTKGKDYQKKLRECFAEIVNSVSKETGGPALYDARSYEERGVDAPASKKLGYDLHAAEAVGIPTKIGIENEQAQAEAERRSIRARFDAEEARLVAQRKAIHARLSSEELGELHDSASVAVRKIDDAQFAAATRMTIELLELELHRERSRAERTRDRQSRAAGKGLAKERTDRAKIAEGATEYLTQLNRRDAELLVELAELKLIVAETPAISPTFADEVVQELGRLADVLQTDVPRQARQSSVEIQRLSTEVPIGRQSKDREPASAPSSHSHKDERAAPPRAQPQVERARPAIGASIIGNAVEPTRESCLRQSNHPATTVAAPLATENINPVRTAKSLQIAVDAIFHRLDAAGVRFVIEHGEVSARPLPNQQISRVDELLIRWAQPRAEELSRKQTAEISELREYLLLHGAALAATGKDPTTRHQQMLSKWGEQPKVKETLAWFDAERRSATQERQRSSQQNSRQQQAGREGGW